MAGESRKPTVADRPPRVRKPIDIPAAGMAAAVAEAPVPLWPGRSDGDAVRVRDRIGRKLAATVDLSPASLPPGVPPDLSDLSVAVDAGGVATPPRSVRVPFAGGLWLARLRETRRADGAAELVYDLAAAVPAASRLSRKAER